MVQALLRPDGKPLTTRRYPWKLCRKWIDEYPQQLLVEVSKDPLLFLNFVWTLDEHDGAHPIKRFPPWNESDERMPWEHPMGYLWEVAKIWYSEPLIVMGKSRQMMATWLITSLYLWDAAFHVGRRIFFQSLKEEHAVEKLKASVDVLRRLPPCLRPHYRAPAKKLVFPEHHSQIQALAQGESQVRQYTFSGGLCDEAAMQPEFGAAYAAMLPTIERGARLTIVSSASPGFFSDLYHDVLGR